MIQEQGETVEVMVTDIEVEPGAVDGETRISDTI